MSQLLKSSTQSESFESPTSVRVLRIINLGPTLCRSCWNHQPQSELSASVWVLHSPASDPPVHWIINLSPGTLYHQPQSESFKSTTPVRILLSRQPQSGYFIHQHRTLQSFESSTYSKSWSFEPSTSVWGLWIIRLSLRPWNHPTQYEAFESSTSVIPSSGTKLKSSISSSLYPIYVPMICGYSHRSQPQMTQKERWGQL